jgi:prepilin-type N-terminal cleavage/methylation domain-containing protein
VTVRKKGAEQGFTLVELLIVMVILPLIVAAVAVAIITTEKNAGTTKARLSDSTSAQITSEYFVPDVQSAQFLTTTNVAGTQTMPSVCGTGTTLLLGLYRPATSSVGALSVGYWLTPSGPQLSSLTRYTCTVAPDSSGNLQSSGNLPSSGNAPSNCLPGPTPGCVQSRVHISDDVSSAQGSITPGQFANAATTGWAPVTTSTTVSATTAISDSTSPNPVPWTLPVASTTAFTVDASHPILVATATGLNSFICTAVSASPPNFTCPGIPGGSTTVQGSLVSQAAAVSGVNISVLQPGSYYAYSLSALPRAYPAVGVAGRGAGVGAPALLTLSNVANTLNGGVNNTLTVHGNVTINRGTLTCTGSQTTVIAYSFGAVSGPSAFSPASCASGGPTSTQPIIPDPYQNIVPTYGTPSGVPRFPAPTQIFSTIPSGGNCTPGEYTLNFQCTTVTPGVYVLDQGLDCRQFTGGCIGSLAMANGSPPGKGVLLYLPCKTNPCTERLFIGGSFAVTLPGLNASQSVSSFGTNALQGLVLWQEGRGGAGSGDVQGARLGGTSCAVNLGGTLYLPKASLSIQGGGSGCGTGLNALVGRVIAQSVSLGGSANAEIQP